MAETMDSAQHCTDVIVNHATGYNCHTHVTWHDGTQCCNQPLKRDKDTVTELQPLKWDSRRKVECTRTDY